MDEDNRLLTKLYMAYSPVFDYRSVATRGSQGLTARLGAYFFTIAAMPLEIHITDERGVEDERSRSNR